MLNMPNLSTPFLAVGRIRLLWHFLFWGVYVLFFGWFYGSIEGDYRAAFLELLMSLPVKMLFTYGILYILIPRFLLTKRYLSFIGLLLLTCLTFGLLQRTIFYYGIQWIYDYCFAIEEPLLTPAKIFKSLISMYIVAAMALVIKLIKYIYKKEKEQQELAQKTLEAELKFLKSQIHPHFLFNTLNNLYALTLKNSTKAPEVVLKLSDLLDYLLYECNSNRVLVFKEVDLIKNYLALEKLRYGNRLEVVFNHSIEDKSIEIAPMLILPFVENAFKHGVSHKINHNWILIDLQIKSGQFVLKVENSRPNETYRAKIRKRHNEGIGLKNVKRRLDLTYPKAYDLQLFDEEDVFLAVLRLQLNPQSAAGEPLSKIVLSN